MNSFLEDIKFRFRHGSAVTQLIIINVAVFLFIKIINLVFFLLAVSPEGISGLIKWLAVPADLQRLLWRPWSVVSYMFLHEGLWHLLFNMLMLYWGGIIFLEFLGGKKLVTAYIAGGISGAALFIAAYNIFPVFHSVLPEAIALGASASVLAVMIGIATYVPDYSVFMLFLGAIRLKYIAVFMILIDLVSIESDNPGGHIAHLGGALFGFLYVRQLKAGYDFTGWIQSRYREFVRVFKREKKKKLHKEYSYSHTHKKNSTREENFTGMEQMQGQIDAILDKISQSGYESLSKSEKDFLFRYSKDN